MSRSVKFGVKVASTAPVPAPDGQKTVRLVKRYDRPEASSLPRRDDLQREDTTELALLREKLAEANDRVRRLKQEVTSEIEMLTAALNEQKEETIDQVRRRISRLRGALEYRGHAGMKTRDS